MRVFQSCRTEHLTSADFGRKMRSLQCTCSFRSLFQLAPPSTELPDQVSPICLRRWRSVSSLRHRFWQRWSQEYVSSIRRFQTLPWELSLSSQRTFFRRSCRWSDVSWQYTSTLMDGTYRRAIHRLVLLPVVY